MRSMTDEQPSSRGEDVERDGRIIELHYSLGELPSSQHRAGLAGLVLLIRWLRRQRGARRGMYEITRLDASGLTLRLSKVGLAMIFDAAYSAFTENRAYPFRFEEREPSEVQFIEDASGVTAGKTLYIYPARVPKGAFLVEWDRSADGLWIKLWRDAVFSIFRSGGTPRLPYVARTDRRHAPTPARDVERTWCSLTSGDEAVKISSTDLLGGRSLSEDGIPFMDRPRFQFLLNFWPFVGQIYVPRIVDRHGTISSVGYVVAIPDVADLEIFCDELEHALTNRTPEENKRVGCRPRGAIVDLGVEGGLDFFVRMKRRVSLREGQRATADLVLGVDVFHMERRKNRVFTRGIGRVDPDDTLIDAYARVRGLLWSTPFRRQRIVNLIDQKPWHDGFDRLIVRSSEELTLGCERFRHDARIMFENEVSNMQHPNDLSSLSQLVLRFVGAYVRGRLESKYGMTYAEAKKRSEIDKYRFLRRKIARDAFLAVRGRTGEEFSEYFVATLGSVRQHIKEPEFEMISEALFDEARRAQVRTITLLALCARG